MFDIKDFYPSIKEDLLIEALEFAKQHVTIKPKDRETIFHARKSLLYNENLQPPFTLVRCFVSYFKPKVEHICA